MSLLLLSLLVLEGQDAAAPDVVGEDTVVVATDLYTPPAVRPYEMPPSVAEGLSPLPPEPPAIIDPVHVEAYDRSYEGVPDPLDQRFQIGLESARLAVDGTAGPLNGRWTLRDRLGLPLFRLVLADPAPSGLVEGAWRDLTVPAGALDAGVVGATERVGIGVRLEVAGGVLTVMPDGSAWSGDLVTPEGRRRITLSAD